MENGTACTLKNKKMNLILIRHAKSSWNNDLLDHNRPLSKRGINDALVVFQKYMGLISKSSSIICSSATRTIQTAKIFTINTNLDFSIFKILDELYTFDSYKLEKIIKKYYTDNLIVFGHNPAITDFVNKFGNYNIENVPTCGIVIINFEKLNTISPKQGVIVKTIFPRDFKE
jgi:phosphohistidine phosphatase